MYRVKEIIYTLQGEGAHTGRAAVLCRFSGCNLWSGHEVDRATALCAICDTDFVGTDGPGGGWFDTAAELADAIARHLPGFEIDYHVDPVRQAIADTWPRSLDDSAARTEWGWQPRYDLEAMTADMIVRLTERLAAH